MYSFKNDYSELCHPEILEALLKHSKQQFSGYGLDDCSVACIELLKSEMDNQEVDVHFLSGGTQTNLALIAHALKPYEAVISATSGHINIHEAGSIEAVGHKILTIDSLDGKLNVQQVDQVFRTLEDEHMVKGKMVYISNPTEIGTIYLQQELNDLYEYCKQHELYLFVDGARLGSALTSHANDLTLASLSRTCDAFYIGGTKNGALFGEALVIANKDLQPNFRYTLKQRGALLAKGSALSIQFEALFQNRLFYKIGTYENELAQRMRKGIQDSGFGFMIETATNQLFPVFPNMLIERLLQEFDFFVWQSMDQHNSAVRLITSFATNSEEVDRFLAFVKKNKNIS